MTAVAVQAGAPGTYLALGRRACLAWDATKASAQSRGTSSAGTTEPRGS